MRAGGLCVGMTRGVMLFDFASIDLQSSSPFSPFACWVLLFESVGNAESVGNEFWVVCCKAHEVGTPAERTLKTNLVICPLRKTDPLSWTCRAKLSAKSSGARLRPEGSEWISKSTMMLPGCTFLITKKLGWWPAMNAEIRGKHVVVIMQKPLGVLECAHTNTHDCSCTRLCSRARARACMFCVHNLRRLWTNHSAVSVQSPCALPSRVHLPACIQCLVVQTLLHTVLQL